MENQARCIAHEIKNQISICELYSQIIKKHLEKDNIKNSSIDNALICITRALKIMGNNLVELKTLDNLCLKKCNIKDILKESVNLSTVYVQEKDIKITLSMPDETKAVESGKWKVESEKLNNFQFSTFNFQLDNASSPYVYIDENKFLACLINIIKNAIEAIEEKGEINISEYVDSENVIIKISNNGKQITNPEHIFDEGFTTKKTGSGLGLSICKEYLKEQNASLELSKSTKDLTEFKITLPAILT